jgi:putative transposase
MQMERMKYAPEFRNEAVKQVIVRGHSVVDVAEAKSEIFDYIEGFYNRVRCHKHLDQISPQEFERQRQTAP